MCDVGRCDMLFVVDSARVRRRGSMLCRGWQGESEEEEEMVISIVYFAR